MNNQPSTSVQKYGIVAQGFHWIVVLLIVGLLITNAMREGSPGGSEAGMFWLGLHTSFGMLVFVLTLGRIIWAKLAPPPQLLDAPKWSILAAKAAHMLLNLSTLAIPVFGYLRAASQGYGSNFFGLQIPALIGERPELHQLMKSLHGEPMVIYLLTLVGLHIAAALWHQYILKDHALERMLPWSPPRR